MSVLARRLDDRIRKLCKQALAARSADELHTISAGLRSALREHNQRLREKFALTLDGRGSGVSPERRAA